MRADVIDLNAVFSHVRELEKKFEDAKDIQMVLGVFRHLEHVRRVWEDISNALKQAVQNSPDSAVDDRVIADIDGLLAALGRMSEVVKDWRISRTEPEPAKSPQKPPQKNPAKPEG